MRSLMRRQASRLYGKLFKGTGLMTLGNTARFGVATVTFLIVARSMGAHDFGLFVPVLSIVGILAAFAGCGTEQLVIRRVARNPESFPAAYATGFAYYGVTMPVLVTLALVLTPLIIPWHVPTHVVLLFAVSDIVLYKVNAYAAACYQSMGKAVPYARQTIQFSILRLLSAVIWSVASSEHDIESWAWYFCGASAVAAAISAWRMITDFPAPQWKISWSEWMDGFFFALQAASGSAFREVDKPVIAALSLTLTVGIYAAAFRIADGGSTPLKAFMTATYRRFFKLGETGAHEPLKYACRLLPLTLGISVVLSLMLIVVAQFAARIFGSSYVETENVLVWLAIYPPILSVLLLGSNVLISSGYLKLRLSIQFLLPLTNLTLCFLLVPRWGPQGAAWAALGSHTVAATATWGVAIFLAGKSRPPITPE